MIEVERKIYKKELNLCNLVGLNIFFELAFSLKFIVTLFYIDNYV